MSLCFGSQTFLSSSVKGRSTMTDRSTLDLAASALYSPSWVPFLSSNRMILPCLRQAKLDIDDDLIDTLYHNLPYLLTVG